MIAEKLTDDGDNPVKYLIIYNLDASTEHLIRSFSMRWRIETFFEDSKQYLDFGVCKIRHEENAERLWQLVMLAYSFLRLGPTTSTSPSIRSRATS